MELPVLKDILYVDDDSDIRELVRISLEDVENYRLDVCSSGQEAIIRAEQLSPQLVILDVMMPDVDGISVFKHYQALSRYQKVPFVFLTAKAQDDEVNHYKSLGVAGVISKPFDPVNLGELIESIWTDFHQRQNPENTTPRGKLTEKYIEGLNAKRQDILTFIMTLNDGSFSESDRKQLQLVINNLIGSGKTFGYEDISTEAGLILKELDTKNTDNSRLSALLLALVAVMDRSTQP